MSITAAQVHGSISFEQPAVPTLVDGLLGYLPHTSA